MKIIMSKRNKIFVWVSNSLLSSPVLLTFTASRKTKFHFTGHFKNIFDYTGTIYIRTRMYIILHFRRFIAIVRHRGIIRRHLIPFPVERFGVVTAAF